MYRYTDDVDRYVAEVNRNSKNEDERGLRALTIAKLYYGVDDYFNAIAYLDKYDNFRTNSGPAQSLRGQVKKGPLDPLPHVSIGDTGTAPLPPCDVTFFHFLN